MPLRLEILDELGHVVLTVADELQQEAGEHSVQVHIPSTCSVGSYYYRYTYGSDHSTGRFQYER